MWKLCKTSLFNRCKFLFKTTFKTLKKPCLKPHDFTFPLFLTQLLNVLFDTLLHCFFHNLPIKSFLDFFNLIPKGKI